jgi:Zn-dependent protease/predicted transcriptional regulator
MGNAFQIIRILGIPVRIHYSWFLIFFLFTWTLAELYFPFKLAHLPGPILWGMAVATALLFFISILLHELAHSLLARSYGITIQGITLFVFGGVAQMVGESRDPKSEMWIAAAGPIVSFALAAFFGGADLLIGGDSRSPVSAVLVFLALSNGILALFNLVPGFPLDGGRILCAILWNRTGNIQKATRITSRMGKGFAVLLMILGFLDIFRGYLLNGFWMIFIGLFLRQAAEAGYQNVLLRRSLSDLTAGDLMKSPVITIHSGLSLESVVNDYFFRHRFHSFPVMSGERMEGMISLDEVKAVDRREWPARPVSHAMDTELDAMTVSRHSSVVDALEQMVRNNRGRLAVMDGDRLVGMVSQKDILQAMKISSER